MKPPKNILSLSNEALEKASRAWDGRLAELIEQHAARDPEFREALNTTIQLDIEKERRAK